MSLARYLSGKISVFAGPSGVGKSSLLNVLLPDLRLKEQEVSQATTKGKHTTVVRELYPLPGGGYVADTPGLKALGLWDIEAEELDGYFPEMHRLVADCQFNNCTHVHEPGCAVLSGGGSRANSPGTIPVLPADEVWGNGSCLKKRPGFRSKNLSTESGIIN